MLTLRPTAVRDLPTIQAWEADPDTAVWLGETGRSWHERALVEPAQDHVVAEDRGTPVGFAVLVGPRDGEVELRRLVVAPTHRGGGRGRALLRAAIDRAGADSVWLDVKPGNTRARALYETEGFVVTGAVGGLVIMRRPKHT